MDVIPSYRLEFEIPGLPELPQKRRSYWVIKKAADRWREVVKLTVKQRRPPDPLSSALITLTRRSSVEPDYDNLVASFKPVVDALTLSKKNNRGRMIWRADVLVDDRPSVLARRYLWEKAPPGKGSIHVVVQAIESPRYVVSCDMEATEIANSVGKPGSIIEIRHPKKRSLQTVIRRLYSAEKELDEAKDDLARVLAHGREKKECPDVEDPLPDADRR